jgi:hypothetical protein
MQVKNQNLEAIERRELRQRKLTSERRAIRRAAHRARRSIPVVVLSWQEIPAGLSTAEWLALPGSEDSL